MRCNTRTNWEFYAVTQGRCAPVFRDGEKPVLRERTLWVFAPECSHAWRDDRRNRYDRVSMHFNSAPYPLDEVVRQHGGWLERPLTATDGARLAAIADELERAYCQPNVVSPLLFQRQLLELTLLLLEGHTLSEPTPTLTELALFKTERAIAWYVEHLDENPTVEHVATAVSVSPSHLRRLFWQSRRASPKQVFRRLRCDRAMELMGRTSLTLDEIAAQTGYASASHLCRDCRAMHHFTPTTWRKKLVDRFSGQRPTGDVLLRQFSARPAERLLPA